MNTMLGGAPEEMRGAIAAAQADIEALLGYMGDNAFFFGNKPTGIDATIAGLFANWLVNNVDSALSDYLNTAHRLRIMYSALSEWCLVTIRDNLGTNRQSIILSAKSAVWRVVMLISYI
ncbi:hypothetical protein FHQ26_02300 [Testudinibacter sp. TR-2022]|uniref:glutathione S-transferase C-terminal domain-containing protein n=1 Tax=Testudinibacter sp. TR-2022 TaxID=2585029 RepID=UPI00111A0692|nr:glutathione S-transferase C-terminal domain-containing protein [Testudinibacter sp. TR-2022]TNH11683.1 hypothetical protein FHQ25_02035 [Testudinibacter sp. TR-2022]TNH12053.1 hypothetical protein FHQ26_02300 [Testudinibacter sp. TR-2022]TNH15526.1 hypothetical protein FHQ23_09795 [Testudinibacter sp. TR-2022]TNH15640.1 hypothetical protein FIA56_02515 [Testudinibacter sp. TR-2022]